MVSISPSFIILGLVVVFVAAEESTENSTAIITTLDGGDNSTAEMSASTATDIPSTSDVFTSTMNTIDNNGTIMPAATTKEGDGKIEAIKPTPNPGDAVKTKPTVPKDRDNSKDKGTPPEKNKSKGENIGIIILVVIIIVALLLGVACFFARHRGRNYSVDLTSRPDDANIPLSTVEPELPIDASPQNGLQTFEGLEATTQPSQEPEAKPEAEKEQKTEADKSAVEPSAESAAPAPPPDSSEDKPKEDVVEPSPPPPVEPSVEEKTDDEGVVSNKTSVESLKETNENNSNNADLSQETDLMASKLFWDVPLDCPV